MNEARRCPVTGSGTIFKNGQRECWEVTPVAVPANTQSLFGKRLDDDLRMLLCGKVAQMTQTVVRVFQDMTEINRFSELAVFANR